jgi:hypothetical protein
MTPLWELSPETVQHEMARGDTLGIGSLFDAERGVTPAIVVSKILVRKSHFGCWRWLDDLIRGGELLEATIRKRVSLTNSQESGRSQFQKPENGPCSGTNSVVLMCGCWSQLYEAGTARAFGAN